MHYICIHLKKEFPKALFYSRFIQIEHRVFAPLMFFLNTVCFGKCTGITFIDSAKMNNRLMPLFERILLRKRSVIETINDELKNIYDIEHSRRRSVNNFIMNLIAELGAYRFFEKKPAIKIRSGLARQIEISENLS